MHELKGAMTRVRIYIGDADNWQGIPLDRALLERLRREGFAGATVLRGIAGFGASSVIHTSSLLDLSADLPILIEVVDTDAHIERLRPILDEMILGGALVTEERVHVVKYGAAPKRGAWKGG